MQNAFKQKNASADPSLLSFSLPPPVPFRLLPRHLEVGPLTSNYVWGSAVSSPSGVWGAAPAEIEFAAFWP